MTNLADVTQPLTRKALAFEDFDWLVAGGIIFMHIGMLLAPFYITWTAVVLVPILYWFTGGLGVTLGYHRLLTHGSFKTTRWLKYTLTAIGCMAWQGPPTQWVGLHRLHHQHSDNPLDPHTPRHGFTWSHMLWCMFRVSEGRTGSDAAKDLLRDPGLKILNRFFWVPPVALAAVLFVAGEMVSAMGISASGISWVVWGTFVRTVLCFHATWFVNSASHTWGYRNFQTNDNSRNLWWVALISFGEGWHNNHHAFQRSAAHGMRRFEFDLTYLTIKLLRRMGLVWNVVVPPARESVGASQPVS